ncbi:hypothetical protein CRG98_030550, partial [Punica granatum]
VGSNRPPEGELGRKSAGPDWSALGLAGLGLGLRKKGTGPRPVNRKRSGSGGSGGDGAAGGGSRPWTPR